MEKFPFTDEGYLSAKLYLIDTGQLYKLENEQSVDGYTLIQLANKLYTDEVGHE